MTAIRFLVTGVVQGVGYRNFVWRRATTLGLRGWVRNLAGGGVEVVATGDQAALDGLERLLHQGPPRSRVDHLERVEISDDTEPMNSFEIR